MPMPMRERAEHRAVFAEPAWRFDPELLFVECTRCGRPVIWEQGRATELLSGAGLDGSLVDERCMILTDGCFTCAPELSAYETRVVRVRSLNRDPLNPRGMA